MGNNPHYDITSPGAFSIPSSINHGNEQNTVGHIASKGEVNTKISTTSTNFKQLPYTIMKTKIVTQPDLTSDDEGHDTSQIELKDTILIKLPQNLEELRKRGDLTLTVSLTLAQTTESTSLPDSRKYHLQSRL